MDDPDFEELPEEQKDVAPARLSRIGGAGTDTMARVNRRYTLFVKSLRWILPLIAVAMTVVIVTWDEGVRTKPMQKEELIPQSENIQNELLKPVFNSVDKNNQPFTVTADRATQNRQNPDLIELNKPVAELQQTDGSQLKGEAASGLYAQKEQKLNLEGAVKLKHSDGYTLSTEELRIDLVTQKAYSGMDVRVEGPAGSIDATGLEGDGDSGALIFTGPAKVILNSDSGSLLSPAKNSSEEKTP